jgi:hypothetical protein
VQTEFSNENDQSIQSFTFSIENNFPKYLSSHAVDGGRMPLARTDDRRAKENQTVEEKSPRHNALNKITIYKNKNA